MIALHPELSKQRNLELHRAAASHRRASRAGGRRDGSRTADADGLEQVTIRRLGADSHDRGALERLAGRDSAAVPAGDVLGAEIAGRLVAAVSLTGDERLADPFTPTAEARTLLELRAAQLRAAGRGRQQATPVRRLFWQLRRRRPLA